MKKYIVVFLKGIFICILLLMATMLVIGFTVRMLSPKPSQALVITLESADTAQAAATAALSSEKMWFFDIDMNGFAERMSAFGAGSYFLAWDLNGNQLIDSKKELFYTTEKRNAFERLAMLDSKEYGGNEDGVIDAQDKYWNNLVAWCQAPTIWSSL